MSSGADRIGQFKNKGKDVEVLRRQRSDVTIELRKKKKDDQLFKRRNMNESDLKDLVELSDEVKFSMSEIVVGLKSTDPEVQLKFAQTVRKILSREREPPIDIVINAGITPILVKYLCCNNCPSLQLESAWALTNIASGTSIQTRAVVDAGAVKPFIQLLGSSFENLAEQAVWALGNIAGDGAELRDVIIKSGIIQPLLQLITPNLTPSLMRNVAWTLSNLCRNKNPSPPFNAIKQLIPVLAHLLYHNDIEVVTDVCWAFSYLTDGTDDKIAEVVAWNIIPQVVKLMQLKNEVLLTPALRIIGNIVTGTEGQTQMVIVSGALNVFGELLCYPKGGIQKEAAWTISNILAGSVEQIQSVIDAKLLVPLVELLEKGEFRAQKEAAWAVTNMTSGGTVEQIALLVVNNFIPPLCKLLTAQDVKLVLVVLDGIYNILKASEKMGEEKSVCFLIEECEGLDKIELLQEHENRSVYANAYRIIEEFFNEEEEDQNANPSSVPSGITLNENVPTHFDF